MTLQALLDKTASELVAHYIKMMNSVSEGEAKSMEAHHPEPEQFAVIYRAYHDQFLEAVDVKYKLSIIRLGERVL